MGLSLSKRDQSSQSSCAHADLKLEFIFTGDAPARVKFYRQQDYKLPYNHDTNSGVLFDDVIVESSINALLTLVMDQQYTPNTFISKDEFERLKRNILKRCLICAALARNYDFPEPEN